MAAYLRSIQVGDATVTVINVGDVRFRLGDWLIVPEAERPPYFAEWLPFPIHCVHIAVPGMSVLVDAAIAENALLIATHIESIGQLEHAGSGVTWSAA